MPSPAVFQPYIRTVFNLILLMMFPEPAQRLRQRAELQAEIIAFRSSTDVLQRTRYRQRPALTVLQQPNVDIAELAEQLGLSVGSCF